MSVRESIGGDRRLAAMPLSRSCVRRPVALIVIQNEA